MGESAQPANVPSNQSPRVPSALVIVNSYGGMPRARGAQLVSAQYPILNPVTTVALWACVADWF